MQFATAPQQHPSTGVSTGSQGAIDVRKITLGWDTWNSKLSAPHRFGSDPQVKFTAATDGEAIGESAVFHPQATVG